MFLLTKLNMNKSMQKSSNWLLNVRILFFGVSWIHLLTLAVVMLPIDFTVDEDPTVRNYQNMKFKFITAWFNFMLLAYFPVCIYCDWKEKCNQENVRHVAVLRKIRDVLFTSILFPTIVFADLLFWRLYYKDLKLISPERVFDYAPGWCQHSLHTVSLIVAFVDLIIVYRQRPKSLKPRFMVLTCFFVIYALVIWQSYVDGQAVYALFDIWTGFQCILLIILSYLEMSFHFIIQWYIIDYVWGKAKTI